MLAPCQYVQNLPRLYAEHKGGRGMAALLASPAGQEQGMRPVMMPDRHGIRPFLPYIPEPGRPS